MAILPQHLRGRYRLVRILALISGNGPATITGAYGLKYRVPSVREPIATGIISDGAYERATLDFILEHLPPHGVFIDVGANIGAISLPVARLRPDSKIFAIEADPGMFNFLHRNIEQNSIKNVTAIQALIGNESRDEVHFNVATLDRFGMGSIGTVTSDVSILLPQITLDQCVQRFAIGKVAILKLDIEGSEYFAFAGAERILKSHPKIVFEFADWAERNCGVSPGSSQRLLSALGFRLCLLDEPTTELAEPLQAGAAMLIALPPCGLMIDGDSRLDGAGESASGHWEQTPLTWPPA